jgi:hypothetical protein
VDIVGLISTVVIALDPISEDLKERAKGDPLEGAGDSVVLIEVGG